MATTIKPYNQAQNNYASGVSRTNEENIRVVAAKTGVPTKCAVKVVPVDTQGVVLTGATVTLNGTAGKVSAVGNIAYGAAWSTVTVKVELAGYQTQEFTINLRDVDVLKEVTLVEEFPKVVKQAETTVSSPKKLTSPKKPSAPLKNASSPTIVPVSTEGNKTVEVAQFSSPVETPQPVLDSNKLTAVPTPSTAVGVGEVASIAPKEPVQNSVSDVASKGPEVEVTDKVGDTAASAPEEEVSDGFTPFTCLLKIADSELNNGQENKAVEITINATCPLSKTGKKRFPGCEDMAAALKALMVNGALQLQSTNLVPGEEIVLKSPFRVSDLEVEPQFFASTGTANNGEAPSRTGLYAVADRTVLYFYLLDMAGEVSSSDQYLCKLGTAPDGFTLEIPVVEDGSQTVKQKVDFTLALAK